MSGTNAPRSCYTPFTLSRLSVLSLSLSQCRALCFRQISSCPPTFRFLFTVEVLLLDSSFLTLSSFSYIVSSVRGGLHLSLIHGPADPLSFPQPTLL